MFFNLIYFQSAPNNHDEIEPLLELKDLIVPPNGIPQHAEQDKKEEKKDEDLELYYSREYRERNKAEIAALPANSKFGWHIICRGIRIG